MRSSKSRSRSKSNRNNNNRQVGNIVNRVFDSSGPEGKVRGTPQQIIEKYDQLARDAQLSGDRVATENFQQHAEHYTRLLAEAMREQAERQAQQQQNNNNNQQNTNQQNSAPQESQQNAPQDRQNDQPRSNPRRQERASGPRPDAERKTSHSEDRKPSDPSDSVSGDVIDVHEDAEAGLVETPENKMQKPKRVRKKATPEPVSDQAPAVDTAPPDAAE